MYGIQIYQKPDSGRRICPVNWSILPLRNVTLLVFPDDGLGLEVGLDDEGEHAVPQELL